jgi:hypothetical protein
MVGVHKALKNSYSKQHAQKLGGYILDKELSNHNQQVYFHPQKKQLLNTIAGTHNWSDVGTDAALAFGRLKNTKRYKEAKDVYEKAKKKYGVDSAKVVGHSLGGTIASYIANPAKDHVVTLDKGATIGQKARKEEKAYRSAGDYVSLLAKNDTNMTTLRNPKTTRGYNKWWNPFNFVKKGLDAHLVDNIKGSGLKI